MVQKVVVRGVAHAQTTDGDLSLVVLYCCAKSQPATSQPDDKCGANHNPFQKDKCISHYVNFNVFLSFPSVKIAVWQTFELSSGRGLITVWLVS